MNTKQKLLLGNLALFVISFFAPAYQRGGEGSKIEAGFDCAWFALDSGRGMLAGPQDGQIFQWLFIGSWMLGTAVALFAFIPVSMIAFRKNPIPQSLANFSAAILVPVLIWVAYWDGVKIGYFMWTASYLILCAVLFKFRSSPSVAVAD